jgi:hypothetical protein
MIQKHENMILWDGLTEERGEQKEGEIICVSEEFRLKIAGNYSFKIKVVGQQ